MGSTTQENANGATKAAKKEHSRKKASALAKDDILSKTVAGIKNDILYSD